MPKGLEISKKYFETCLPVLKQCIPDIMEHAATGLAGEGSDCLGFDDATSRDHDWGPAFCLWLPESLLRSEAARIEQAIDLLPKSFMGFAARMAPQDRSGRVGPMAVEVFYRQFLGMPRAPETWREWRAIPEYHLCSSTNGAVFMDNEGVFSAIRNKLLKYYPEDLRRKKIAARCMIMAQTGQYNLPRCLSRGDFVPAMLAAARFSEAALSMVYLLNRRFMPFYKWAARGAAELPVLGRETVRLLDGLSQTAWSSTYQSSQAVQQIENLCSLVAETLRKTHLSEVDGDWLWAHGPSVQLGVREPEIRRLNVMED